MKPAAIYLRRSTDRQQRSIGDQRGELEGYAQEHGLRIIDEYRAALRLGPSERARLRIGQIYLQIGFVPEARSALERLSGKIAPDLATSLRISLTEAAYQDGEIRQAMAELEELQVEPLADDARLWAHRRRGDVLAAMGRYPPAADEYRSAIGLLPEGSSDPGLLLRLANAYLASGLPEKAEKTAAAIEPGPSAESALAGLVRSVAQRKSGDPAKAVKEGLAVVMAGAPPRLAALAGVAVLEGERLRGRETAAIPPGTSQLLSTAPSAPGLSLLAYMIARLPVPGETQVDVRRRIGELSLTLPEGPVRGLVERDLAERLGSKLSKFLFEGEKPDPKVIDDLLTYVHLRRTSEDLLLRGMETFSRSGDQPRCSRWARALQAREVRPIRRGVGVWRESLCSGALRPNSTLAAALVRVADSGQAGAFSLPLVTLAAEGELRSGNHDRALELYERAVEGFGTPDLIGPVLIRVGELRSATQLGERATRPVVQGLALLDPGDRTARSFRVVGVVTLLRSALREKPSRIVRTALKTALRTAPVEWKGIFRYMASRAGIVAPPTGDGLFARAAREVREAERLIHPRTGPTAPGLSATGRPK